VIFPVPIATRHRRSFDVLVLSFVCAIVYGAYAPPLSAQGSYAPGVEGQIWQQLPIFGRGVDLIDERPITTSPIAPTFSDPSKPGIADLWPCTADDQGYPLLCYSSGTIGVGAGVPPDVSQQWGARFAPCIGNQCYASGFIGKGTPVTWAMGPCVMRAGALGTDCYPSGTVGDGTRTPPANGQFTSPWGITVDNNPASPNAGTIYITDKWNYRVQGFHFDGSLMTLQHPIGNGYAGVGPYTQDTNGQTVTGELLDYPERIKVDASGHLLIADAGNGRIAVFDTNGILVDSLSIPDSGTMFRANGLWAPSGMALTPGASFRGTANPPGSLLVVADGFNCAIYAFDASSLALLAKAGGQYCSSVGQTPAFDEIFGSGSVSLDNAGHVFAADYDRNRIEIFDAATMTMIGAFGDPSAGAVAPAALNAPTDVMVDHNGRVWVADAINQRLAAFQVTFNAGTPTATFLFDLNAAGDLNGWPGNIAEDTSHDPVGKILTTDADNSRVQRFQVPDLALLNLVVDAPNRTVSFDVLVPLGKDPVGVTTVTPIICPTSLNTTVTSGTSAPQAGCAAARALTSAGTMTPGQTRSYSFQFVAGGNQSTFDVYATGNVLGGVPQTTSNHVAVAVATNCPACTITPQVVPPTGALQALTPPVAPAVLYVGARTYTTQVSLRLTATSPASSGGLAQIFYHFISGPETGLLAQGGMHSVPESGTTATLDVPFRLDGTSIIEFWSQNVDGTESVHNQAKLTLHLVPPTLAFVYTQATSANATQANAAGWWNKAVSLPVIFTGQITAVTPLVAGMAANPPLMSPLTFTTSGRNLGFSVTVTDSLGLSVTRTTNDAENGGQGFNIDLVAPTFTANAAITLERASYDGAPPPAANTASLLALATDPALADGTAGSGVVSVAPAAATTAFPMGTAARSFIAGDAAGNTRTGNINVTVRDTVKPVLTCPAAVTINGTVLGTLFTQPGFSVTDASMINAPVGTTVVTVTQSLATTRVLTLNTPTAVTLTATDPSGNTATCATTVTAKLLTPPTFTKVPVPQTVEGGAAIDLVATAIDSTGAALTVTSNAPAKFPVGSTTVTFTAKDAANQTTTASVVITVVDTKAPVISACAAPATVPVSAGSAAAYPALSLTATDYSTFTVTQSPAAGSPFTLPAGQPSQTVNVTLTATDSLNHASSCTTTVTFSAASPLTCTAAVASPSTLWPPNHQFALIAVNGVTSADGKPVTTTVTSIRQDEPTQGLGDGDTPIDGLLAFGLAAVRAERSGKGNGRVYYLAFTATSANGGSCTGTVTVGVPHDQAHPAIGDGPTYDSTQASGNGDNCHGQSDHGHHDGDGCNDGHHGHYDGDECGGRDGYHHDGDGHGGGRDGGSHRR
jgi:hypothetical protein